MVFKVNTYPKFVYSDGIICPMPILKFLQFYRRLAHHHKAVFQGVLGSFEILSAMVSLFNLTKVFQPPSRVSYPFGIIP
jgi:hypothetical protein